MPLVDQNLINHLFQYKILLINYIYDLKQELRIFKIIQPPQQCLQFLAQLYDSLQDYFKKVGLVDNVVG